MIIFILIGCAPLHYVQSVNEINPIIRENQCWEIYLNYPDYTQVLSGCDLYIHTVMNMACLDSIKQSNFKNKKPGPINGASSRKENGELIIIKSQAMSSDENSNGICKNIIYYDYQQRKVGGVEWYLVFTHILNWDGVLIVDRAAKMFEWEKLRK